MAKIKGKGVNTRDVLAGAAVGGAVVWATGILPRRMFTNDPHRPWAEAAAVSGNEIVYVGENAGALGLAGEDAAQYDIADKMLLPGFIDANMHPVAGGAFAKALSLDTSGTVDEWIEAIADYAEENSDAPLIFDYGFLATTFGPTGPTRQMIDAIVPDRAILIMNDGMHGAWANTRALEELNITRDAPDPVPGFSYYKRDENGDATRLSRKPDLELSPIRTVQVSERI